MTINRTKFIYLKFLPIILVSFLASCVFQEQVGEVAVCNEGQTFNAVERRCEAIIVAVFSMAALSSVVVEEDAGVHLIELSYLIEQ